MKRGTNNSSVKTLGKRQPKRLKKSYRGESRILEPEVQALDFDINYTDLHLAANEGNIKKIIKLLKVDADLLNSQDSTGLTALHHAVLSGKFEAVKALVSQGADVNIRTVDGYLPIFFVAEENPEIKKFLEANGSEDLNYTQLHQAAYDGNIKEIIKLLKRNSNLLNGQDSNGNTALHFAVLSDNLRAVEVLVSHGADVNISNDDDLLPIQYVAGECPKIKKYLEENGSYSYGIPEIHLAAADGDLNKMEQILNENPEKLDLLDGEGRSPLFEAVSNNKVEMVKYLVNKGANLYLLDNYQRDIVYCAKNSSLLSYMQKLCGLSKKDLASLREQFTLIIKNAAIQAELQNKKILIIIGETHFFYKILQVEKMMMEVVNQSGIDTLLGEFNKKDEIEYPTDIFAKNELKMEVNGIDNRPKTDESDIDERNIVMTKEIFKINKSSVVRIGSDHLKGLLEMPRSAIDSVSFYERFYIVPFNLSCLFSKLHHDACKEMKFSFDNRNNIQIIGNKFSDSEKVVRKWNAPRNKKIRERILEQNQIGKRKVEIDVMTVQKKYTPLHKLNEPLKKNKKRTHEECDFVQSKKRKLTNNFQKIDEHSDNIMLDPNRVNAEFFNRKQRRLNRLNKGF